MYISCRRYRNLKLGNVEPEIVIVYWDPLSIFNGENKVFIVSMLGFCELFKHVKTNNKEIKAFISYTTCLIHNNEIAATFFFRNIALISQVKQLKTDKLHKDNHSLKEQHGEMTKRSESLSPEKRFSPTAEHIQTLSS